MTKTTAIARNKPSIPARWLSSYNLLKGRCLDFGSGRGMDADFYNMKKYDPHWEPKIPGGLYDTITCTYVLNVVSIRKRRDILQNVSKLLVNNGSAYFAVRRDIPKIGKPGRNCYQYYVILEYPYLCIKETSSYAIYELRKNNGKNLDA